MADKTGIQFEIDARTAKKGADDVDRAIARINKAMDSMSGKFAKVSKALQSPVDTKGFNRLASAISKLNNLKIDGQIATGIKRLNTAMTGLGSVNQRSINSITNLQKAIGSFSVSNLNKIVQVSDALKNFRGPPPSAADRIKNLVAALASIRLPTNLKSIITGLNALGTAADHAATNMSRLSRSRVNLGGLNAQLNDAAGGFHQVAGGITIADMALWQFKAAIASFLSVQMFRQFYDVHNTLLGLSKGFEAVTGSVQGSAEAMAFANSVAAKYGFSLTSTTQEYLKFSAAAGSAGVKTAQIQKLFEQVSGTTAVLKLGTERTSRAFQALTQMISKGQVTAEELKQQLGEHIPGAVNIFARALGVGTAELLKMVENGEVGVEQVLKFGDELERTFGSAFKFASESAQASLGRLLISWQLLADEIGKGFYDQLGTASKSIVDSMTYIDQDGVMHLRESVKKTAAEFGAAIGDIVLAVGSAAKWLIENFEAVKMAVLTLGGLRLAGWAVGIAAGFSGISAATRIASFFLSATFVGALESIGPAAVAFTKAVTGIVGGIKSITGAMALGQLVTPWGLVVAAIAAVGVAIYGLNGVVQEHGGWVQVLSDAWYAVKDAATVTLEWIWDKLSRLGSALAAIGEMIGSVMTGNFGAIAESFTKLYDAITNETARFVNTKAKIHDDATLRQLRGATDIENQRVEMMAEGNAKELANHLEMNAKKQESDAQTAENAINVQADSLEVYASNFEKAAGLAIKFNSDIRTDSQITWGENRKYVQQFVATVENGMVHMDARATAAFQHISAEAKAKFLEAAMAGKELAITIDKVAGAAEGMKVKINEAVLEFEKLPYLQDKSTESQKRFGKSLDYSKESSKDLSNHIVKLDDYTHDATKATYNYAKSWDSVSRSASEAARNIARAQQTLHGMQGRPGNAGFQTDIGRKSLEARGDLGDYNFYAGLPEGNRIRQEYMDSLTSKAGQTTGGSSGRGFSEIGGGYQNSFTNEGGWTSTTGSGAGSNNYTKSQSSKSGIKFTSKNKYTGGDVFRGTTYTVGEKGPELYVGKDGAVSILGLGGVQEEWKAPSSGYIYNASDTKKMMTDEKFVGPEVLTNTAYSPMYGPSTGSNGVSKSASIAEEIRNQLRLLSMNQSAMDTYMKSSSSITSLTMTSSTMDEIMKAKAENAQLKITREHNAKMFDLSHKYLKMAGGMSLDNQSFWGRLYQEDKTKLRNSTDSKMAAINVSDDAFTSSFNTQSLESKIARMNSGAIVSDSQAQANAKSVAELLDLMRYGKPIEQPKMKPLTTSFSGGGSSGGGSGEVKRNEMWRGTYVHQGTASNSMHPSLQGLTASLENAGRANVKTLGGYMTGGSFEVPSNGGADSTLAQLMLSGGERVDITPARMNRHQPATDRDDEGEGGKRTIIVNMEVKTPDPDAFRLSQKQLVTKLQRQLSNI